MLIRRLSFFFLIHITLSARQRKTVRCKAPEVINADFMCTTQPKALSVWKYDADTRCNIYCKENYEFYSGPKAIDCYRGQWLHAGKGHIPYDKPTTCEKPFLADGRSPRIAPTTTHDGMCSSQLCNVRYSGITKKVCEQRNCCWNRRRSDCYQYAPFKCQIPISERVDCPETWYGIPQSLCNAKGCCFDDVNSKCYSAKSLEVETIEPRNELERTTNPQPVTEGHCEEIQDRAKTFIDCTNGFYAGSTCSVSCARGYKLILPGKNHATCQQNGKWSQTTSWQCREIQCPEFDVADLIDDIDASSYISLLEFSCTKGRKFGSVCAVTCPLGYWGLGSSTVRCGVLGQWTKGSFECIPLSCPSIHLSQWNMPTPVVQCTNQYKVGSTCNFSCAMGYRISGSDTTTCRPNQKWSYDPSLVKCTRLIKCEEPHVPAGAVLHCTADTQVGTLCSITCPKGKLLRKRNINVFTCMDNMSWDHSFEGEICQEPPTCSKLEDAFPESEWDKLTVVCTGGYQLGSVCSVDCGTNGDESSVMSCITVDESATAWVGDPPTKCTDVAKKTCDLEIDLDNGKVIGDSELLRVRVQPTLPIWNKSKRCAYQSIVEVQYNRIQSLAVKMTYGVPRSLHFQLSDHLENAKKSLKGRNFSLQWLNGLEKGIFRAKSDMMILLKRPSTEIIIRVGKKDTKSIPLDLSNSSSLFLSLNRAVKLSSSFDISGMGSGMCKLCLAYTVKNSD